MRCEGAAIKSMNNNVFIFIYLAQEHSKPNMYKSGVVDAENGGSSFSDIRTSTGSFVPKGV